jgi:hypothetical protein
LDKLVEENTMRNTWVGNFLIILIGIIGLSGCNITPSSGWSMPPINNSSSDLGILSNGSIIYISSANFSTVSTSSVTGSLGITEGLTPYQGTVTFKVRAAAGNQSLNGIVPYITTSPALCTLDSANPENLCQITLSGNGALPGTYIITPTITSAGVAEVVNNFTVTVIHGNIIPTPSPTVAPTPTSTPTPSPTATVTPTPTPTVTPVPQLGNLVLHLSKSSIKVGESTAAIVILSNSNIQQNLEVTVTSSNVGQVAVSGNGMCLLSSVHNSCSITVIGIAPTTPNINIIATAKNPLYKTASAVLSVGSIPGSITLALAATPILLGESTVATITLNNAVDVTNLPITLTVESSGIANINPPSCVIKSSIAPNNTCSVTVTAGLVAGTTSIAATSPSYTKSTTPIEVLASGWVKLGTNSPAVLGGGYITALLVDNQENVYVATTNSSGGFGYVFQNSPGNNNWNTIGGGYTPDSGAIQAITLDNQGNIYAGTNNSSNGAFGYVWQSSVVAGSLWNNTPVGGSFMPDNSQVNSIAYSNMLYVGTSGQNNESGTVFHLNESGVWSDPNGNTQAPFAVTPDGSAIFQVSTDPRMSEYYYASTTGGNVYQFIPSISPWTLVGGSGLGSATPFMAIVYSAAIGGGDLYTIGANTGTVYSSLLPTGSWLPHVIAPSNSAITAIAGQGFTQEYIFIATSNGVYHMNDMQSAWVQSGGTSLPWSTPVKYMALTSANGGYLYVATSDNVYKCVADCGKVF